MKAPFSEIAEQYQELIYHLINKLHIYRDKEEFYQTGLIALWEAYEKFDDQKAAFLSYAYALVRGRMLDLLKQKKRLEERNVYPDEEFWMHKENTSEETPLELDILHLYCIGMTEKQVKWTILTFYHGMSVKEIASLEQVTISAVKKWKRLALERIRQNIEQNRRDEPF
ncbi:sigma-70 family RNA polymerase sigma factor [Heyndrickxia acidicola]|uniref:Sigma-70 family RNA polymerase sigma factor n=1 Tax=Heyndrickxia acidicola TaxID=209389 RepID=A0ABU6MNS7_9BACI|nr:sigma-70 family RNA polymerase sigma factor [Heyndrickxia acidicola]MED1204690.1 sigma-70 family RNA polymerase sigma factor [Heyndrickxia acidicola]